ncbi:hypothetical protein PSTT_13904 [Puccinia striiformis]|uniref:Uncharacterized protein n=1 Tax=Puccinia striiformis TaxID=27350 RepID=A0A2S4UPT5_9BASI|nr:hypothetical protein PSTT_13904 [Puccinia striiformis]
MRLLEFFNCFFVICGPTTSAIKSSAILPMVRFPHDPGPCFRHPLAYNSGTPICLAQHSASYWSWYHFLVFLGMVFVRLARSWASLPISSLVDIKGPLSIVVSPSSSHHISSSSIQTSATPTRSSSLSSVVVSLLLSNMSSFNQTSSAHQHQNPPPYQRYQNHGYSLRPRAPAVRGRGGRAPRSARPAVRTSPLMVLVVDYIMDPGKKIRPSPTIRTGSSWCYPPTCLRMPVNAPEPEARPFSVARPATVKKLLYTLRPALESLTNAPADVVLGLFQQYLRPENADAGPAWVNPPTPRPHNLATPPSPLAPAGFDPSPRADAWAQRTSSASSGSAQSASLAESLTPSSLGSNSGIIMYHRLNDDQIHLLLEDPDSVNPYDVSRFELPSPEHHYAFLATNFINYCHEFPTSNPVIQCEVVLDSLNVQYNTPPPT